MQRQAESGHIPLAPSEAQSANKNCSVRDCRETEIAGGYGNDSQGEGLAHSWQVYYIRPMLVAPGGYKWIVTGTDTYPIPGFAYFVIDANAHYTIKGLEQKVLYQFGLLSYISSD